MWIIKFRFSFTSSYKNNNNNKITHTHTHDKHGTWYWLPRQVEKSISTRWFIEKPHIKTINFPFSFFLNSLRFVFSFYLFSLSTPTTPPTKKNSDILCWLSLESHSNSPNFPFQSLNSYNNNVAKSYTLYVVWFIEVSQYKYYATFCWLGISKQQQQKNLFFNDLFKRTPTQNLHHKRWTQIQQ